VPKPYDKVEWQKIAQVFLTDKTLPPSALESAHIALQRDDPELSELCLKEAKERRKSWGRR
tara:strand:+ start:1696 stop:1878 length:183 start_codon:yes stop_codon:yes gene_type:complete